MAIEFLMPKLGLTMEEGTILEWLVEDGAPVAAGDAVLRIETDKVESDVEAAGSGRLHRVGQVGDTFACGVVIAYLLDEGEATPAAPSQPDASPATSASGAGAGAAPSVAAAAQRPAPLPRQAAASGAATYGEHGRLLASPNARRVAAERGVDLRGVRGSGPGGRIVSADVPAGGPGAAPAGTGEWAREAPAHTLVGGAPATAAARQLADLLGVDPASVPYDAADGRVSREDVARHVRSLLRTVPSPAPPLPPPTPPAPAPAASVASAPPASSQSPTSVKRLAGMRGTIARRMHASLQEMAQLTLTMDADVAAIAADRSARRSEGTAPSYTDYVIAAVARALRIHPIVNSQVTPEGIALLPDVHVSFAVALDDGLIVPVVRHTDRLDLDGLAGTTRRLAAAARSGTLSIDDLDGGTFSVSTLGSFGVDAFTPVINPPNTAILGVGRVREELVLRDGVVAAELRMTLSLTWDHRVFDGAPAAAFARTVVDLLTDPAALDRTD